MSNVSFLDSAQSHDYLKKAMETFFEGRYPSSSNPVSPEQWKKDALEILDEVPKLVCLLALYRDREKIFKIFAESNDCKNILDMINKK